MRATRQRRMRTILFATWCGTAILSWAQAVPPPVPGTITTFAGNGKAPFTGDGKKAIDVQLFDIFQIAFDGANNLYIADYYYDRVFKVTPAGITTAIAGNDRFGYSGDGGKGTSASLYGPRSVASAPDGTVYIGDVLNNRIRKVTPAGIISTAAGGGSFYGSGAQGPDTELHCPESIALNNRGYLAMFTYCNDRLYMMDPGGLVYTLAGNGKAGPLADGTLSYLGALGTKVNGVASDDNANWYVAVDNRIRKIDGATYIITTIGGGDKAGFSGDGGPATAAMFNTPYRLTADKSGNLYVPDQQNHRIRKIDSKGIVTTIAGTGVANLAPDNASATASPISLPSSVAVDTTGAVYFSEQGSRRVRKILPNGQLITVAGRGLPDLGDGAAVSASSLIDPQGVAVGPDGSVYLTDQNAHQVRCVDINGVITTIAGTGIGGYSGDGGPAVSAQLNTPRAVAVDTNGNVYVSDTQNHVIRRISADGGIITTVAGIPGGTGAFSGDGGLATQARLNAPQSVVFDAMGNMYIADYLNHRIRMVDSTGVITTFAGDGTYGNPTDGVAATASSLGAPVAMVFDSKGMMYVTSAADFRVRTIAPDGTVNTIAGAGVAPLADGTDELGQPHGLAIDSVGNLFISENTGTVKMLSNGILSKLVGDSGAYSGDGGEALAGALNNPRHLAFLPDGSLLVADAANKRIRRIAFTQQLVAPK